MRRLNFDPRTKLFLVLLCVFCVMLAPDIFFQFVLVCLIGLLAALCGKWRQAIYGILTYALICLFTAWCMKAVSGVWQTMFVAFLGLVHKVYACGR